MDNTTLFSTFHFSMKELELLRLLYKEDITEESLEEFFKNIDIENMGLSKVTHIAHLCQKVHFKGVPKELKPRLQGISRFWVSHNAKLIMNAFKLIHQFNEAGIDVLLCKGIAMRLGYAKKITRNMWDVDLTVRPKDHERALKIANGQGYKKYHAPHSTDLAKDKDIFIDLHPVFNKTAIFNENAEKVIWDRSIPMEVYGERVYLPSVEDMLVQLFSNAASGMYCNNDNRLKWVCDCMNIIQLNKTIDWDKVVNISFEQGVPHLVYISMDLLSAIFRECRQLDNIKKRLQNNRQSRYNYKLMGKLSIRKESYFKARESCSVIRISLPWLRYHWNICRFYNHGGCLYKDMLVFPAYMKKVFRVGNLISIPKALFDRILFKKKVGWSIDAEIHN